MTKLHELLAVEGNLKGQAATVRGNLQTTFEKKRHLFEQKLVTFTPFKEVPEEGLVQTEEAQLDLQSTVYKELRWVSGIWAPALDVSAQVAEANTRARADVVLEDGMPLFRDMPATALLELEKRLAEMHALLQGVPTLDPAKGFQPDTTHGEKHVYKARPDVKIRTKKLQRPIVLHEPTVEHPAQTQLISEDVNIGRTVTQEWSGLLTPAEKSELLEKTERLQRAVKAARSRANEAEVKTDLKIGATLFEYILGKE